MSGEWVRIGHLSTNLEMSVELRKIEKVVDGEAHIYPTDLSLHESEINVLLGATLSGKTTLMRLMAGLEKPTSGEIWVDGRNVTGESVQKRNVAMVYQEFINYPHFTVFDNIASPLQVAGRKSHEIKKRVEEIAELLDLVKLLDRDVSNLSGGQQQRTALARALVKSASLVLLDEPLANLDYKLREQLRDELPRLFAESSSTVVYATSEPEEALMLGGCTATLHEGQVIDYGKTLDLYRKPCNLHCARIFSHPPINVAPVSKAGGSISFEGTVTWQCPQVLANHPDGNYVLGIRPHHVSLSADDTRNSHVCVKGTVQLAEISGSASLIHLGVAGIDWILESSGVHQHSMGESIEVHLNLDRCLYFDEHGTAIH